MNDEIKVTGRILPISEATKARNPDLFAVGPVESAKRKQNPPTTLVCDFPPEQTGALRISVCITGYRRRLLDDDNFAAGAKPLRDAIARELGIDDGDSRIKFEYHQIKTQFDEGTAVKISITYA